VPISVAGWGVIVQRPTAVAFATIERFHRLLVLAIGVFILGGVIFWILLSRRVIVPLEHLAAFSQMVGQRQRTPHAPPSDLAALAHRSDQMGNLTRSLLAMADDIEQRFVELSTLLETSRVVVSSLDATAVIDSILNEVQRLLNADRTAIVALDERLDVFRIRASRGLSEDYVRQLRIDPAEPHSAAMRALRTQTPVQITDTEQTLDYVKFVPRARQEGFRSLLAVPLLTQHAPPAVLLLYFDQPHRCSEAELELVASFANHAAMAMENASLYARSDAQLQEQTRRLEAIVESLNDGLILEGLAGRVLYCNQRAADLLGVRRSLACRRPTSELIEQLLATAEAPERAASELQNAIAQGNHRPIDIIRRGPDGRPQDLRIYVFEVTDARGKSIGRGQYWQDFTHDKDLDRMKSALLSTVSHELRTPLAAIKGYATTLLAQDVAWDAETQREFIQTISDETDRLASLVSDLLDLSRLEGGALEIRREVYPIAEIIRESARRGSRRLDVPIQLDIPPDLPPLWVDRPRLETVLRNLFENAVKYSPPDSPVEISARRADDAVVIAVRDYGPGVPKNQQDMIFDRFYRGDIERDRRVGGAGLGLAICKGFIEAHGGRIWVEDANPGAVFLFTLPFTAPDPQDVIYDSIPAHSGRR
jgi:PAS domain S-box-containing protein